MIGTIVLNTSDYSFVHGSRTISLLNQYSNITIK